MKTQTEFKLNKIKSKFYIFPLILVLSIFGQHFKTEIELSLPIWLSEISHNTIVFSFWISLGAILNFLIDRLLFVKIFGPESPGQPRQRKLVMQLVHFSIISICLGLAMKQILSPELGTMVAGSGVLAIVLGLALQSTLSDFFAGVALNIERPYKAGEWVTLEDKTEGLVLSTNWRSTHLKTRTNDILIIPNSTMAKDRLINRTRPDLRHVAGFNVKLRPGFSFEIVQVEILRALASIKGVIMEPAPLITIDAYTDFSCQIKIYYLIGHYSDLLHIHCELGAKIYDQFNKNPDLHKYWPKIHSTLSELSSYS